jgi:hypothetical protein
MSSSSPDEVGVEEYTREIREQRIVIRFDYLRGQAAPQQGAVPIFLLNCSYLFLEVVSLS